jgi:hypothetical protein
VAAACPPPRGAGTEESVGPLEQPPAATAAANISIVIPAHERGPAGVVIVNSLRSRNPPRGPLAIVLADGSPHCHVDPAHRYLCAGRGDSFCRASPTGASLRGQRRWAMPTLRWLSQRRATYSVAGAPRLSQARTGLIPCVLIFGGLRRCLVHTFSAAERRYRRNWDNPFSRAIRAFRQPRPP